MNPTTSSPLEQADRNTRIACIRVMTSCTVFALLVAPRRCIDRPRHELLVSERRICAFIAHHRSTHRKVSRLADKGQRFTDAIIVLATQSVRYDYGRVAALLRQPPTAKFRMTLVSIT